MKTYLIVLLVFSINFEVFGQNNNESVDTKVQSYNQSEATPNPVITNTPSPTVSISSAQSSNINSNSSNSTNSTIIPEQKRTEYDALILALLQAGIGFLGGLLAVGISSLYSHRQIQNQNQETADIKTDRTIELYRFFRPSDMKNSRNLAWNARKKWYSDLEYKERLCSRFYSDYYFEGFSEEEADEISAIFDVLEYFNIIAIHPGSDNELKVLGFYYQNWRGFLYEIIEAHEIKYEQTFKTEKEKKQCPPSYTKERFYRLDERLGLPPYVKEDHPLDRQYLTVKRDDLENKEIKTNII